MDEYTGVDPNARSSSACEPVAIIGMGCRLPGDVTDPESFWKLMCARSDAIGTIPPDRWDADKFYDPSPGTPGKYYTRRGGFLRDLLQFDAGFFGISPREARRMDPHQKLLLEVVWEALEDAGLVIDRKTPRNVGVFVGLSNQDYTKVNASLWDLESVSPHTATGISFAISANRISHSLNFNGPSLALDTACSSSLVAVHLACQSLAQGECEIALAGGANVILSPETYVSFCKLSMLSPDGYCKAFDASANGFVRSEGAGVVVLKPLGRALKDNNSIYAIIRGTGSNQDASTPGITLPDRAAQEALMRRVCGGIGIDPGLIGFVEAHGTGTAAGDPIEAAAIGSVIGKRRPSEHPCFLGSVKTNIGHLESASGIAGLIKAALVLSHREVPPNLHFTTPNPEIDFENWGLEIPRRMTALPEKTALYAAVNSFGFGGTNAHIVLSTADAARPMEADPMPRGRTELSASMERPEVFCISAHNPESLRAFAGKCRQLLSDGSWMAHSLGDICGSALLHRARHAHRLAVTAESHEDLAKNLVAFEKGETRPGQTAASAVSSKPRRVAFVFAGQGTQWWAMGRELFEHEPVYRDTIRRCDGILSEFAEWSLLDELNADEPHSRMQKTSIAQPAIFALQAALLELWKSYGVHPDAAVGHSVGEVAAAFAGGIYDLAEALRVIYHRGRCMEFAASSSGRMLAVGLSANEVAPFIQPYEGQIHVGAVNSPESVTLTGDARPLEEVEKALSRENVFCRFVRTQYAFHSHHMDGMREELQEALEGLHPCPARIPVHSTVRGRLAEEADFDAEYWWDNVRRPVRFSDAIDSLIDDDSFLFLEIGPHPVLASAVTECLLHRDRSGVVLPSLKRDRGERFTLRSSLGALHAHGIDADWSSLYRGPNERVHFPTYAWTREPSWHMTERHRNYLIGVETSPLLGAPTDAPQPGWESQINPYLFPFLEDHRIQNQVLIPGTAYIELALSIARQSDIADHPVLEDVHLHKAAFLPRSGNLTLRSSYVPEESRFEIHSREGSGQESWHLNVTGSLHAPQQGSSKKIALRPLQKRLETILSGSECYERFRANGIQYGPAFQGLYQLHCGQGEALGEIRTPETLENDLKAFGFHPALLDACLQSIIGAGILGDNKSYIPVYIKRLRFHGQPHRRLWCHVHGARRVGSQFEASLTITNDEGHLLAEVYGLRLQGIDSNGDVKPATVDDMLYRYEWIGRHLPGDVRPLRESRWLVFDDGRIGTALARELVRNGDSCITVRPGPTYTRVDDRRFELPMEDRTAVRKLLESVTSDGRLPSVVDLWSLNVPRVEEVNDDDVLRVLRQTCWRLTEFIQEATSFGDKNPQRLFIVTRGAQSHGAKPEAVSAFQTTLWGLGRVIVNELPKLKCALVDLDPRIENGGAGTEKEVERLAHEIQADAGEDEVAFRNGERLIHRLRKTSLHEHRFFREKESVERTEENFRLETSRPGVLDNLTVRLCERRDPSKGEVEVQVHATGLNFSDIMKALGLYPGLPEGPVPLGIESSGIVVRTGPSVRRLHPGDRVVALAPFSFGAYVTVSERFLLPFPNTMSFEEAATLPIPYLTAFYGLVRLSRLSRGERVLIHSASGGVGLAAIQIAKQVGAEIYATAGTPEKRRYLEEQGIRHVMDSRSLSFAGEVMERTNGEGIDVVLNSLAGEAISKGLSVLRDYGRFVEIGKKDIYENRRIGLYPFHKNLSLFSVDLDKMMREHPGRVENLLGDVQEGLKEHYSPLPHTRFMLSEVKDAFRYMAQAKHIGKVIVTTRQSDIAIAPATTSSVAFRADASYLITGGFGGFGLVLARWLVDHGARHIALMGRRGAADPHARETLTELGRQGAHVLQLKGDVSRREDLEEALSTIALDHPPLRGVFHAATVLEDTVLDNMDMERMVRVMEPKIKGAFYLHRLTRALPLDLFVLFSSISSIIGMPGQGNYVAANAFLDGLSYLRRSQGLPSQTINWGYLGKVGIAARNPDIAERFANQGLQSFSPEEAMELMARFIRFDPVQIAVIHMDWSRFGEIFENYTVSPKFSDLWNDEPESGDDEQPSKTFEEDTPSLRKALITAAQKDQRSLLNRFLTEQVACIAGTAPERLDPDKPLTEMGFDSLMAIELRNWVENNLGVQLPTMEVMRGPSVRELSGRLLESFRALGRAERIVPTLDDGAGDTATVDADDSKALDDLSDEEVNTLLHDVLERDE